MKQNLVKRHSFFYLYVFFTILIITFSFEIIFSFNTSYDFAKASISFYDPSTINIAGTGTDLDPYIIDTEAKLSWVSEAVNNTELYNTNGIHFSYCSYALDDDIDLTNNNTICIGNFINTGLSDYKYIYFDVENRIDAGSLNTFWAARYNSFYYFDSNSFVPATSTYDSTKSYFYYDNIPNVFSGKFDGNNHVIKNYNSCLFGYCVNATICNLIIDNFDIEGTQYDTYLGCLAIGIYSSTVSNVQLFNCNINSTDSSSNLGLLVGETNKINNSTYSFLIDLYKEQLCNFSLISINDSNSVDITEEYCGGVVASSTYTNFANIYSNPSFINSNEYITTKYAGFVGETNRSNYEYIISFISGSYDNGKPMFFLNGTNNTFSSIYYPEYVTDDETIDDVNALSLSYCYLDDNFFNEFDNTYWKLTNIDYANDNAYVPSLISINNEYEYLGFPIDCLTIRIDSTLQFIINVDDTNNEYTAIPEIRTGFNFIKYYDNENDYLNNNGQVDFEITESLNLQSEYVFLTPVIDTPTTNTVTYNGNNQVVVNTLNVTHGLLSNPETIITYEWFYSANNESTGITTSNLSLKNHSDSSDYYCKVTITNGSNSSFSNSSIVSVTINQINLIYSITNLTTTYDGSAKSVNATLTSGSILPSDSEAVTLYNNEHINVGEYQSYIECDEYQNYNISYTGGLLTINPATISATITGFNGIYDGNQHSISVSNISVSGNQEYDILYSTNGINFSSTNPSYTNFTNGNKDIYVKITANNHEDYLNNTTINISKETIVISQNTEITLSKVYNNSNLYNFDQDFINTYCLVTYANDFDYEHKDVPAISISEVMFSNTSVGNNLDATVTCALDNSALSNNFAIQNSSISFTGCSITPLPISYSIIDPSYIYTKEYDGSTDFTIPNSDLVITSEANLQNYTNISITQGISSNKNFGDVSITVSVTCDNPNYSPISNTFNVYGHINKKMVTLDETGISAINREYDGTKNVVVSGGSVIGLISPDECNIIYSNCTIENSNVGTNYEVSVGTISLTNNNYYIDTGLSNKVYVDITKATPVVEMEPLQSYIYSYTTILPTISIISSNVDGSSSYEEYTLTKEVLQNDNYSFNMIFTPNDSINYNTVIQSYEFGIYKVTNIEIILNGLPSNYNPYDTIVFDGNLRLNKVYSDESKIEIENVEDSVDIVYEHNIEYITIVDEFYTLNYTDEIDVQHLLNIPINVSKIVVNNLTINQTDYIYTGTTINISKSSISGFNQSLMEYNNDSIFSATDVGTYQIKINLIDEDNYEFSNNSTVYTLNWNITYLKISYPTLDFDEFTFSGKTISPNIVSLYSSYISISGDIEAINKGEYEISVEPKNNNVQWVATNDNHSYILNWHINPKPVSIPILNKTEYNYTGKTINAYENKNIEFNITGNPSGINVGNYSFTISLVNNNYIWNNETTDPIIYNYSIIPFVVTLPTIDKDIFTFTGNNIKIGSFSTDYYTYTGTNATNAGLYDATFTLKNTDNYIWSNNTTTPFVLHWSIEKLFIDYPSYTNNLTYNSSNLSCSIAASSFYTLSGTIFAVNVGNYTTKVVINQKNNVCWQNGTSNDYIVNWSISPLKINKPEPLQNLLYNGFTQTNSLNTESVYYSISGNTQKDIGSYIATISLTDKQNTTWTDNSTEDLKYSWNIYSITIKLDEETTNTLTEYVLGTELSTPTKLGYTFAGWYIVNTTDGSETKVTKLDSISDNVILTAKWIENKNETNNDNNKKDNSSFSIKNPYVYISIIILGVAFIIFISVLLSSILKRRR
ncbi:MAG: hypothetical protein K5765_06555 [Clostridia bacterium]|nr:hypothetical protein [Clostridia bacterium]